jgi:hypothetical protein
MKAINLSLAVIAAAAAGLFNASVVNASPAGDFVKGRHWMCYTKIYNASVVDAQLPLRLILSSESKADGYFVNSAFLSIDLDGKSYIGSYNATGYLFDNTGDGAGIYVSKMALQSSDSDNLYATVLRWPDQFALMLHVIPSAAGSEYPYELEGQYITPYNYTYDMACTVMQWPPVAS